MWDEKERLRRELGRLDRKIRRNADQEDAALADGSDLLRRVRRLSWKLKAMEEKERRQARQRKRLRKALRSQVEAGLAVCARCGERICRMRPGISATTTTTGRFTRGRSIGAATGRRIGSEGHRGSGERAVL